MSYSIVLTSVDSVNNIQAMKTVREVGKEIGLRMAKNIVENVPSVVATGMSYDRAQSEIKKINRRGAKGMIVFDNTSIDSQIDVRPVPKGGPPRFKTFYLICEHETVIGHYMGQGEYRFEPQESQWGLGYSRRLDDEVLFYAKIPMIPVRPPSCHGCKYLGHTEDNVDVCLIDAMDTGKVKYLPELNGCDRREGRDR